MPRYELQGSAQPCGCDEGADHVCQRHVEERDLARIYAEQKDAERSFVKRQNLEPFVPSRIGPTRPQLPADPAARKTYPVMTGLLRYFPDACAEVAHLSFVANEQHNPGESLHWDRAKSMDQEDTLVRHLMEAGTRDADGQRHSTKVAWRALAALQLEIEAERA